MNKCRTDRFFLFTLNQFPQNILLSVWRQGHDLPSLHAALSKINPDGVLNLGDGIGHAFRILNLNRLQAGYESYGMGLNPSQVEHAVVIVISHFSASFEVNEELANKLEGDGSRLTAGSHRWDYWIQGVLLHYSGLVETVDFMNPPDIPPEAAIPCLQTGGTAHLFYDPREFVRDIEVISAGIRYGVMVDIVDTTDPSKPNAFKQLILLRENVKVNAFWTIPEAYWPTDELSIGNVPPRPSNPIIHVQSSRELPPNLSEYFPVDRYELDSSPLTRKIVESHNTSVIWPCFVPNSGLKGDAPFGYCRLSPEQNVHLYVLPYNYRVLSDLLSDFESPYGMRITEGWCQKMSAYYESIPRYYHVQLLKALERIGIHNAIKTDGPQAILPFGFLKEMQKIQIAARNQFDGLVAAISKPPESVQSILIPRISIPTVAFMEIKPFYATDKPFARHMYEYPWIIPRSKLRKMLPKLRDNFDAIIEGVSRPMDSENIHSQAVSEMGNYTNYRFAQPRVAPLRDLVQPPERVDTFGNPFHRKSNSGFLIDEVSVDDMGLSGSTSNQAQRSPFKPRGRIKGPLPADFCLYVSRPNSHASSPFLGEARVQNSSEINGTGKQANLLEETSPLSHSHSEVNGLDVLHSSQDESAFTLNVGIVDELITIVRSPKIDGSEVYRVLSKLTGSRQQKYDSVSYVMAEALRFKRVELFKLLREWRSYIGMPLISPQDFPPSHVNGLDLEQPPHLVNGSK
ncbi:hypothetical protein Aperf_G00000096975 [Anoplocephala perfoliata]